MKKFILVLSVLQAFLYADYNILSDVNISKCKTQCVEYNPFPKCTKKILICKGRKNGGF